MRTPRLMHTPEPPASHRRWLLSSLGFLALIVILGVIRSTPSPTKPDITPPVPQAKSKGNRTYERWLEALQRRREAAAARRAAGPAALLENEETAWDVLDSAQAGNQVSALVRQPGPLPWVRVEATIEVEESEGVTNSMLVGRQSLAADRMEVRLKQGASVSAIDAWLAGQGARLVARPEEAEVFDVIWDKPGLQTLPQAVPLLASQPEWFAHVQPVTARFDHEIFSFAASAP